MATNWKSLTTTTILGVILLTESQQLFWSQLFVYLCMYSKEAIIVCIMFNECLIKNYVMLCYNGIQTIKMGFNHF